MDIFECITTRHACRAYLDKAVDKKDLEKILDAARWSPSGVNSQPWQVAVVSGQTKQRITQALIHARDEGRPENPDYDYYPAQWREPYKTRRKQTGLSLYNALGVKKDDPEGQKKAWYNNYRLFGAPLGLLFFIDKDLGRGSWLDMGMFMQNIMLAATGLGLATCPQASLCEYPGLIRNILNLPDSRLLIAGMSLGYADQAHPVNNYRLEREPAGNFSTWYD